MNSYAVFMYLNLLDIVSTLAVLKAGGREANPVTLVFMSVFPACVVAGLILAKAVALPSYWFLLKWGVSKGLDEGVILRAWNFFYMAVVVWNLSNLI